MNHVTGGRRTADGAKTARVRRRAARASGQSPVSQLAGWPE
jgi:hypothetical protein